MNYSTTGPPLSKSYLIVFFWLYNSSLRPHFHVCYSTCNFSRTTFQDPHMKTWTVPGPCPHLSWCPSTCSFLVPATFPGQNWVHSHMHPATCSGVKRTNKGLLSTLCVGFSVWPGQPQRPPPWLTRAEAQARRRGLLALNPCSATPKSPSLGYCRCLLPSAVWCWCRHRALEPWKGTPGLWLQATGRDELHDMKWGGSQPKPSFRKAGNLLTAWSLPHVCATSTLTWGLQFSIDEGEQLLADATVRNGPGQESVVGFGCFQKEIWVWWEVWSLGWRGSGKQRGPGQRKLTDIPEQTLLLSGMFHKGHTFPGSSVSQDEGRQNWKLPTGSELQMGKMVPKDVSTTGALFSPNITIYQIHKRASLKSCHLGGHPR